MPRTDGDILAEWDGVGAYDYRCGFRLSRRGDGRLRLEQWGFAWRGTQGGSGRSIHLFPADAIPTQLLARIAHVAAGDDPMAPAHTATDLIPESAWERSKRTRADGYYR
jgi:hypothetical protein